MDPVQHCDHLVGKERAGRSAFLWFVNCVLSAMVPLLFLLVSLVGYVPLLSLFLDTRGRGGGGGGGGGGWGMEGNGGNCGTGV